MTATITIPDSVIACRALFRGQATQMRPAVAAIITEIKAVYVTSNGWIDTFIPDPAQLPRNAIRIQAAGGLGPYRDQPGYDRQRVQIDCFGVTAAAAAAIATLVKLALMPPQRNQQGWLFEGTRVVKTLGVTGPLPGVEPNSDPPAPLRTVTADLELLEAYVDV